MAIRLLNCPKTPIDSLGLGVFDGLHMGHQALLSRCSHMLSIYPHPALILGKHPDIRMLTTPEELTHFYPNNITLCFDETVANLSWDTFLNDIILARLAPKKLVVGYDYRFGKGREGSFEQLEKWTAQHGLALEEVSAVDLDGTISKSSLVREALRSGRFDEALQFMGRPYPIFGTVEHGEGRGKDLGFPTANLSLDEWKLLPKNGVYSGNVSVDGSTYACIVYIGEKPTFSGKQVGVEIHIPGETLSVYGRPVQLFLDRHIRGEIHFDNSDALRAQIADDIASLEV